MFYKTFTIKNIKTVILLTAFTIFLISCGGGEDTVQQQNTNIIIGTTQGCGTLDPAPATSDINSFCNEFWSKSNLQNNCASCHKEDQAPYFMRDDNINLAYSAINQHSVADPSKYIVDVNDPSQSYIIDKMLQGHNCWASPQACADIMLAYIENWVGQTSGASKTIQLTAPANPQPPGGGKEFPATATTVADQIDPIDTNTTFENVIYNPILRNYCQQCHESGPGDPLFAGTNVETSYLLSQPRMNLDNPASSRYVIKLLTHTQGCWDADINDFPVDMQAQASTELTGDKCTDSSLAMQYAITKFAEGIPTNIVDPSEFLISDAAKITDGIIASGGARFEPNQIALYEFKTGQDMIAYDTSGSGNALDLTFCTNNNNTSVSWVGGWGISLSGEFPNANCLQSSSTNAKLYDLIQATGEYSIETWVAPNNVTQEMARIINLSGGGGAKNFALSQTLYNYDAQIRNSNTGLDGEPAVSTPDADEVLQATLQHVVTTYDPVNGRQIFVNGELRTAPDPQVGGSINDWSNTYSLVLGNERGATADDNMWKGIIKMVSIHNRALNQAQIQQNFEAGVGEKFFLLFDISHHIQGVPAQSYIMFTVSQFDNYSYLFTDPTYVNLDSGITNFNIPVRSMRIGINSKQAPVGQAYLNLNTTITANNQLLSTIGTTVGLDKGPDLDEFYLIFEALGSESRSYAEPTYNPPSQDNLNPASDIGIKTFDEINATLSAMTGISSQASLDHANNDNDYDIPATYNRIKQQLPSSADINTFVTAHNIGMTQLAMEYCQALVVQAAVQGNTSTLFGTYDFGQLASVADNNPSLIIDPLLNAFNGTGMDLQMDDGTFASGSNTAKDELISLMDNINQCLPGCDSANQTQLMTKAMCTAALSGANTLIQ